MSEFELLVIPVSLVLGLGVTTALAGSVAGFRDREHRGLHWLPNVWALLILVHQVQYFFVLEDLNEIIALAGETWGWKWFVPAFLHATLFFLAAGLIFPTQRGAGSSQLDDFAKHGRFALVALFFGYLTAIPLNVFQHRHSWVSEPNFWNVPLMITTGFVFLRKGKGRGSDVATLLHLVVQLAAMTVGPWSRPGA